MKTKHTLLAALCLLLAGFTQALAQNTPPSPPRVLVLIREDIKPGKMPAHAQEASAYVQVLSKANARLAENMRDGRIAMTPIAGNENEVAYLWPYDSFEEMEKKRNEMDKLATGAMRAEFDALPDAELHASQRDIIARYRPEYSYNIGAIDIAQARYMVMTTLRIKPGHEDEYWAMVKEKMFPARDKAQIKASYAVFSAIAGMPASTFLIFRPARSLADFDAAAPVATRNAMSKDVREDVDKVTDRSVVFSETIFYRFDPRLSHVAPDFVARDTASPAFWNPKPPPPTTPTTARRRPAGRQ
ncbi:MAG: NIPSNAP family protein [Acidobacteriota bacterium]|nr:NIPSNAP family protein [Acidobacteriota bacterium]